jgi:hypothetical protein
MIPAHGSLISMQFYQAIYVTTISGQKTQCHHFYHPDVNLEGLKQVGSVENVWQTTLLST